MDDWQLVLQSQQGDRAAFEQIVRRTSRGVYARLCLETGDPHLAEDLTQETYLRAWRQIGKIKEPERFAGWLQAIAHSVLIDAVRRRASQKRNVERETSIAPAELPASGDPAERAATQEQCRQALTLVRNLPEEYRQVIALRYLAGEDYESMARKLGLSNGSLRGLLHRGLSLLREQWPEDKKG